MEELETNGAGATTSVTTECEALGAFDVDMESVEEQVQRWKRTRKRLACLQQYWRRC